MPHMSNLPWMFLYLMMLGILFLLTMFFYTHITLATLNKKSYKDFNKKWMW